MTTQFDIGSIFNIISYLPVYPYYYCWDGVDKKLNTFFDALTGMGPSINQEIESRYSIKTLEMIPSHESKYIASKSLALIAQRISKRFENETNDESRTLFADFGDGSLNFKAKSIMATRQCKSIEKLVLKVCTPSGHEQLGKKMQLMFPKLTTVSIIQNAKDIHFYGTSILTEFNFLNNILVDDAWDKHYHKVAVLKSKVFLDDGGTKYNLASIDGWRLIREFGIGIQTDFNGSLLSRIIESDYHDEELIDQALSLEWNTDCITQQQWIMLLEKGKYKLFKKLFNEFMTQSPKKKRMNFVDYARLHTYFVRRDLKFDIQHAAKCFRLITKNNCVSKRFGRTMLVGKMYTQNDVNRLLEFGFELPKMSTIIKALSSNGGDDANLISPYIIVNSWKDNIETIALEPYFRTNLESMFQPVLPFTDLTLFNILSMANGPIIQLLGEELILDYYAIVDNKNWTASIACLYANGNFDALSFLLKSKFSSYVKNSIKNTKWVSCNHTRNEITLKDTLDIHLCSDLIDKKCFKFVYRSLIDKSNCDIAQNFLQLDTTP